MYAAKYRATYWVRTKINKNFEKRIVKNIIKDPENGNQST